MALIEAFHQSAAVLEEQFETRSHKPVEGWATPYRLFRPTGSAGSAKLPLVLYLHGGAAVGSDNRKQISDTDSFGTRIWALPQNQKRFPCYIVAPQTDRGWLRYPPPHTPWPPPPRRNPSPVAGFGLGARIAMNIVESLCREFPIDGRRIYVTGKSLGGGATWHMVVHGSSLFAAAVPVCPGGTADASGSENPGLPLWCFEGDKDGNVGMSQRRIARRRKAGGTPIYTEYAGVGHNVWEWAYTEPALLDWLFAQRR